MTVSHSSGACRRVTARPSRAAGARPPENSPRSTASTAKQTEGDGVQRCLSEVMRVPSTSSTHSTPADSAA
ncbi:hypothetical protein LUW77_12220 [Streptomyces radiopugnans]|nr:hypothetical protein LUW77_12220 [Streptomyces radiopugnans]